MKIDTTIEKVDELLERSVAEVLPTKEALRAQLLSGEKLKIYIGTDATGTSLHLGHATNYMVLERFRKLGHEVIFLIGDFTSRIGDPTDKNETARKQLSREEVVENMKTWMDQIRSVIDIDNKENPVQVLFNHDWLSKLTFEDVIQISSHFTVQHMIERDMFRKRMGAGEPLYLHELFYPLMQGYDSVAMDVDIEICGTDQKFNALAGRTLQRKINNKEKFVFITKLLENPITKEKMMSKSLGTGVFLDFSANEMYGGIMAQADENMEQLFTDCTFLKTDEIVAILKDMSPRDAKMRLAFEITKIYHKSEVDAAQTQFVETFQKGGVPEDVIEIKPDYIENLVAFEVVASKSELRRLIEAGGVRDAESGEKLTEIPTGISKPTTLKIGKRRFVQLVL